eukprot:11994025-Alexandrium_andersonii.AAC.1
MRGITCINTPRNLFIPNTSAPTYRHPGGLGSTRSPCTPVGDTDGEHNDSTRALPSRGVRR